MLVSIAAADRVSQALFRGDTMSGSRVRYHVVRPGSEPSPTVVQDGDVPLYGQGITLTTDAGPKRYRIVGVVYRVVLTAIGALTEAYIVEEPNPAELCGPSIACEAPHATGPATDD